MPTKQEQPIEEVQPKSPQVSEDTYLINLEDHTSVSVLASSVEEAQLKAKAVKE